MTAFLFSAMAPPGDNKPGGVASWIETMARELIRRGHSVTIAGPGHPGACHRQFDVGVLANLKFTKHLAQNCYFNVCVSHGVIELERPQAFDLNISTSEEVRDAWSIKGEVLRQPIDCDFWRTRPFTVEEGRNTLLFYSYRARNELGLPGLAARLNLEYRRPTPAASREFIRGQMRRAALTCASGRAALEAMACGSPTVICDARGYQRPLASDSLRRARWYNYSGRDGRDPAHCDLAAIAEDTMANQRPVEWVRKHHCAKKITAQFLQYLT